MLSHTFRLPYSNFNLPCTIFDLPYTIFDLPYTNSHLPYTSAPPTLDQKNISVCAPRRCGYSGAGPGGVGALGAL